VAWGRRWRLLRARFGGTPGAEVVDAQVANALEAARQGGRMADVRLAAAVGMARRRASTTRAPGDLITAGRAGHRYALLVGGRGDIERACRIGWEAVQDLVRASDAPSLVLDDDEALDAALGGAVEALADLALMTARTGDADEVRSLLAKATSLARQSQGPATRRGTARAAHAAASQAFGEFVHRASKTGTASRQDVERLAQTTSQVVVETRTVLDPQEDWSRIHLSEALALHGRTLALAGRHSEAEAAISEALAILADADDAAATTQVRILRQDLATVQRAKGR
jgi:hypothetical protein